MSRQIYRLRLLRHQQLLPLYIFWQIYQSVAVAVGVSTAVAAAASVNATWRSLFFSRRSAQLIFLGPEQFLYVVTYKNIMKNPE